MGSLELPTVNGLCSQQLKSLALGVGLPEILVNGQAGQFPKQHQHHMIKTTSDCFFLGFSLFASFLKQPGFESKPLNEPDPAVYSPFSKVIFICIIHPNKKKCPKCSNAELSRLLSEK